MIVTPLDLGFTDIFTLAQVFSGWLFTALAPIFALVVAFVFAIPFIWSRLRVLMGLDILLYSADGSRYAIPASEWRAIQAAEAGSQAADLARSSVDIYAAEDFRTGETTVRD